MTEQNDERKQPSEGLTYKDAGVSIEEGNRLVDRIKPLVKKTQRPEVLGGLGGFGALFEIPLDRYKKPVLVSGTDGVGTKLKLAMDANIHDTIGIDLVAMCVNDIIVCGAEPLYFLDYYATGKLDVDMATSVVKGIADGCLLSGAALVGGETAEMPGMYQGSDYDLAGFCVGIVEKDQIIDGSGIAPGNALIALASSGPHSNGYSLVRKIIDRAEQSLDTAFGDSTLAATLLAPTRIYAKAIQALMAKTTILGMAHITGGGLDENIPRMLPDSVAASINLESWQLPPIFQWLQQHGGVETGEMTRTFNCGVGMVLCVEQSSVTEALDFLNEAGESAWVIGETVARNEGAAVIF